MILIRTCTHAPMIPKCQPLIVSQDDQLAPSRFLHALYAHRHDHVFEIVVIGDDNQCATVGVA